MHGTILVGIDESTPSRSAVNWALTRAAALAERVELLHVIGADSLDGGNPESSERSAHARQLIDLELARARQKAPDVEVFASLAEGRPAEVLAARSVGHAMLVVGTHKTGFIYGRSFGSGFLSLGSLSACAVAFVPDGIGYDRDGVVVAVDSTIANPVLIFAASEAARFAEDLVLVSSWGLATSPPTRADAALQSAELERARALVRAVQPQVRVRTRTVESPSAEALVESSACASLLVIGRARPSKASNHDVLINMSSPVIVVPVPEPAE